MSKQPNKDKPPKHNFTLAYRGEDIATWRMCMEQAEKQGLVFKTQLLLLAQEKFLTKSQPQS